MAEKLNTRTELNRLLQERNAYPDRAIDVDRKIYTIFEQDCAILILDMSGFSRLTIRYGIIHFLAMIYRMTTIATPVIRQQNGRVVKQEADNLFAVFSDVRSAVDAAANILKAFAEVNTGSPDEQDLYAGIGIGYGKTLIVGDSDMYGSEMNLACKLGEDLARRGEVLLTETAFNQLEPQSNIWANIWERLDLSVSGLELIAYKLKTAPAL